MALGPTWVGRGRAIRTLVVLIALPACLGAVVAYGASRSGSGRAVVGGNAPAPGPSLPANGAPRQEASPRASFIETPAPVSTSSEVQLRFHVPPRTQRRRESRRESPGQAPTAGEQRGLRQFQCRFDGGPWRGCSSPHRLDALPTGSHSFAVRALTRAGRPGPTASYSWTRSAPKQIAIEPAGSVEDLHPGFPAQLLPVAISNPNDVPVEVTKLTVELGAELATCSQENFKLTPAGVSAATPLAIPAGGTVSLPTAEVSAPAIGMLNLPVDQDACQGAQLQLVFRGEAHG